MTSPQPIYLDHAASSHPKPPGVTDAACAAILDGGNPGRAGHGYAIAAARLVHDARRDVAGLLGVASARNLIFQPGCTIAMNLALSGLLRRGDRVVTSSMEHNAVVRPLHALGQRGVKIVVEDADSTGRIDPDRLEITVRQAATTAIVIQHASNVSGTIQPLQEIAEIARDAGALFIVDGAQAGGHLPVDVGALGIDAWACSGHKGLLGIQGTGVLALSEQAEPRPLVYGGTGSASETPEMPTQRPDRYEAGTANVPGIAALGAAAKYLVANADDLRAVEQRLITALHEGLLSLGFHVLGPALGDLRAPTLSVTHPRIEPQQLALELDRRFGIAVRAGLHCAPWAHRTLGTLESGAARFSVGYGLDDADIEAALDGVAAVLAEARS